MTNTLKLGILVASLLGAVPADAQTAPRELRERMGRLGSALLEGEARDLIRFFPRDSPLTIERIPDPDGAPGPVLRRVLHPDSARAELEGTELMCAFGGALLYEPGRWRHVGRARFTSRDSDGRAVWVDWRRERGSWVVRRITEEYLIPRPVLGKDAGEISRDTTAYAWLPEARRYAGLTEWHRTHRPIVFAGRRLMKYGPPRRLDRSELDAVGTLGAVPFFAERGTAHAPGVLYALVGPDEYEPYQEVDDTLEDFCGTWW